MNQRSEALRWANEIRRERGIGAPLRCLPKGLRNEERSCPLAKALAGSAYIGSHTADFTELGAGSDDVVELPSSVAGFVRCFDRGEYPELDEELA